MQLSEASTLVNDCYENFDDIARRTAEILVACVTRRLDGQILTDDEQNILCLLIQHEFNASLEGELRNVIYHAVDLNGTIQFRD